jgi:hypothetical protein
MYDNMTGWGFLHNYSVFCCMLNTLSDEKLNYILHARKIEDLKYYFSEKKLTAIKRELKEKTPSLTHKRIGFGRALISAFEAGCFPLDFLMYTISLLTFTAFALSLMVQMCMACAVVLFVYFTFSLNKQRNEKFHRLKEAFCFKWFQMKVLEILAKKHSKKFDNIKKMPKDAYQFKWGLLGGACAHGLFCAGTMAFSYFTFGLECLPLLGINSLAVMFTGAVGIVASSLFFVLLGGVVSYYVYHVKRRKHSIAEATKIMSVSLNQKINYLRQTLCEDETKNTLELLAIEERGAFNDKQLPAELKGKRVGIGRAILNGCEAACFPLDLMMYLFSLCSVNYVLMSSLVLGGIGLTVGTIAVLSVLSYKHRNKKMSQSLKRFQVKWRQCNAINRSIAFENKNHADLRVLPSEAFKVKSKYVLQAGVLGLRFSGMFAFTYFSFGLMFMPMLKLSTLSILMSPLGIVASSLFFIALGVGVSKYIYNEKKMQHSMRLAYQKMDVRIGMHLIGLNATVRRKYRVKDVCGKSETKSPGKMAQFRQAGGEYFSSPFGRAGTPAKDYEPLDSSSDSETCSSSRSLTSKPSLQPRSLQF